DATDATFPWSISNGTLRSINGSHVTFVGTSGQVTLTVVGTDHNGCSSTATRTVYVTSADVPTITASGPTTFCAGNSVAFTSSSALVYHWSNGDTNQVIVVTQSGDYTVTIGDALGCTATSAPMRVTCNANPPAPTITASGPTEFCAGGSVTLTSSGGASYAWSTGATTQSITVSSTGSYFVTVTDANGCSSSSMPANVVVHSPQATVTASGPTTFCAGGSVTLTASSGATYSWSNGATTQSINVSSTGDYF